MSRRLKRVLHAVERRVGNGWAYDRAFYAVENRSKRAKRFVEVFPEERRHVVYDRDESTVHPGPCLWVIERQNPDGWLCIAVVSTVADRDRVAALAGGPTRVLRFVRRKERAW